MDPNPSSLQRDAELLERYAVHGADALHDPDVAAFVASHSALVGEIDAGLARLRREIEVETGPIPKPVWRPASPSTARTRILGYWPAVSATIGVAGVVAALWMGNAARGTVHASPKSSMRSIATASGMPATVTLDDGTQVTLNAGSTLRIPRDLTASRTVELSGEALFRVSHHGAIPFVVRSGAARVTVLGTEFSIRHYPEDHGARIVVVNGRIALHARRDTVLSARMLGEVSDSGELAVTRNVDAARYTEWTHGRLEFHDVPLRQVFPELERRYGIAIRLADTTLASRHVTLTVTDDPISAILDIIALTSDVRYVRDGNTVTFLRAVPQARRHDISLRSERLYGK